MRNIFVAFAVRLSRLARGHAPLQTFPSFLKHKLPVHWNQVVALFYEFFQPVFMSHTVFIARGYIVKYWLINGVWYISKWSFCYNNHLKLWTPKTVYLVIKVEMQKWSWTDHYFILFLRRSSKILQTSQPTSSQACILGGSYFNWLTNWQHVLLVEFVALIWPNCLVYYKCWDWPNGAS